MRTKICLATHNKGKISELRQILTPYGFDIIGLDTLNHHEELEEDGSTFAENSFKKAKFIFDTYHIPTLADDSGLCVPALNGEPGVFSARYAGLPKDDSKNIQKLLEKLKNIAQRRAYFETVITYIDLNGKSHQFIGKIEGNILENLQGSGGFGYDPIFVPDGYDITFAQMDKTQKNKISHRAKAMHAFLNYITNQ
jgi:XTP/dITP diphosphohydrolase